MLDMMMFAVLSSEGMVSTGRIMRIIRLSRVVRTLRLARSLSYIHEFRKMVYSLRASVTTLFWSLLLLFFVIYGFAVLFVQGTLDYLIEYSADSEGPQHIQELRLHYRNLATACYSLYMSISNGKSWGQVMDPLLEVDASFVALFLVF